MDSENGSNQPPRSLDSIYAESEEQPNSNGLSRGQQTSQTSMIFGILSLFVAGIILGPIAISKANRAERMFQTSATVGKVTGWVGTILGALQIVGFIIWAIVVFGFLAVPTAAISSAVTTQNQITDVDPQVGEPEENIDSTVPTGEDNFSGPIRVGIVSDRPGISVYDGSSDPVGFEADIARFIISDMGYDTDQIEWIAANGIDRQTVVENSTVDMLIANYPQTPEREALFDFAGTYFEGGDVLLVPKDSAIESVEDLDGKMVCTNGFSTVASDIQDEVAPDLDTYEPYAGGDCLSDVGESADATIDNVYSLVGRMSQSEYEGKFKIFDTPLSEAWSYSIAVPMDSEMCSDINASLNNLFDTGAWATALTENFGDTDLVQQMIDSPPADSSTC